MPTNFAEKSMVLDAFYKGLRGIGYPAGQIQRDYGYSNFLEDGQRQTIDLAAFGSAVPSLRTCNIGVLVHSDISPERIARARALGAPLFFTYNTSTNRFGRWRMSATGLPEILDSPDISLERLSDYFADRRTQWEPEAFRQARSATFREPSAQLDFFDVGLLPALEGELQRKLSDRIQNIAARSREIINERQGNTAFERQFASYARLLFRLLAARMLSDRGDFDSLLQNSDAAQVLEIVERKYHAGESSEPVLDSPEVRNYIWRELQNGLDLRNLSPETLAFVYENTLIDRDLRQQNGIHATPPIVADYLLRQLPIERLPENERVIFEPFCGNAPFLLAAMRRLRELLPVDSIPSEVHHYLTKRLLGIEILPFAREIARYSLILGDYPNDNSWQIEEGNAFTDLRFNRMLDQAQVVISNPPHEDFPLDRRTPGTHHNQAGEALRRVLQNPPPLLGFVLPLSFVDSNEYKVLRRRLVDLYPALTITAMPDNAFGKASQQVALVAAHRLDESNKYFWAEVSKRDYKTTFSISGKPTVIEKCKSLPLEKDGTPIVWQRPQGQIIPLWDMLKAKHYRTLKDVMELHPGLEWTRLEGERFSTDSAVSNIPKEGFKPGLHLVKNTVESYTALKISYLDIRPERQQWDALKWSWEESKALINRIRISVGIWRVLSIIDTEGLYASENYLGLWPHQFQSGSGLTHPVEVLSAIINGPIANAFLFYRCQRRHNQTEFLNQIPIPIFTEAQLQEITDLVDVYQDLRWEYMEEPTPWIGTLAERGRRALFKIDAAVLDAYALPTDLESELLRLFDDVQRGHLPFSFTGYNTEEWQAAKAELADDREGQRIAREFDNLFRKRNLYGLTENEEQEYERLARERMLRRDRYRNSLEADK